ncbi:hypothetical protein [Kibdelosporangium phytohabitans]|uniref:hypothetical protein n=1 Tax=Kibdelosporangium phytohabitans TaxID=860235 RepID=UPI0012FC4CCC|nr:hypothetical protein [Kibdelosporangium phytohabitans]MBE1468192.1 hypothetical protein [Kibdelosporangium phytohabitans]
MNALTATVSGGTLDPATVMQRVDKAVCEATEQAMETRVLPTLRAVVLDVIGADNEAQATPS